MFVVGAQIIGHTHTLHNNKTALSCSQIYQRVSPELEEQQESTTVSYTEKVKLKYFTFTIEQFHFHCHTRIPSCMCENCYLDGHHHI